MGEIDKTKKVICICASGGRSMQACFFLEHKRNIKAYNLTGGMNELKKAFPKSIVHGQKPKLF